MRLNEFIRGDADSELMKSLYQTCTDSGKEPSEDLLKAMDKAGLVQVQRTVSGKHGTYTRMQWVKASDVKDSDKVVGGKKPEGEQEQVSKMKEKIKNKYAGAKTHVDRAKIDIEHVEKVRGIKFPEEERKKRLAFAEHLDKKYGDKRISPVEYGEELKEFYNASSPTYNSEKQTESKEKTSSDTKSPTSQEVDSPVKDLEPDKDSEITVADYITGEYLDPEEDSEEIENQKRIAKEMGAEPKNIHIYTSDTVQDLDYFDEIYNYIVECMDDSKEIGEFTVGTVDGKKVAYSYAEGGLAVIYALD